MGSVGSKVRAKGRVKESKIYRKPHFKQWKASYRDTQSKPTSKKTTNGLTKPVKTDQELIKKQKQMRNVTSQHKNAQCLIFFIFFIFISFISVWSCTDQSIKSFETNHSYPIQIIQKLNLILALTTSVHKISINTLVDHCPHHTFMQHNFIFSFF